MIFDPDFRWPDDPVTKIVRSIVSPAIIVIILALNYYLFENRYPWLPSLILTLLTIVIARAFLLQKRWVWRIFGWIIILIIIYLILASIFPNLLVVNR